MNVTDATPRDSARCAAGTIVAKNYLAQARVLATSFHRAHPESIFYTLIVDGRADDVAPDGTLDVAVADLGIPASLWHRMATIYSVLEFATALKPMLLHWMLRQHVDQAWYLDPDIYVFEPLDVVREALQATPIVLTPHNLTPMPRDGLLPDEKLIKQSGIFNLGFIGVAHGADDFLTWWRARTETDGLVDVSETLFADQRWIDFVPALFDFQVLRHPGLNVAYWNLHERQLQRVADGHWNVNGDALLFFHFSGYSPLLPHDLASYVVAQPRVTFATRPELRDLFSSYDGELREAGFLESQRAPYGFGYTVGGVALDEPLRRLYRAAWIDSPEKPPPDPFNLDEHEEFVRWADRVMGTDWSVFTPAQRTLWAQRPDLQRAFPDPFGTNVDDYLRWLTDDPQVSGDLRRDAARVRSERDDQVSPLVAGGWNIVGYLSAEIGLGEAGRRVADAVLGTGLPIELVTTNTPFAPQKHQLRHGPSRHIRFRDSIVAVNADRAVDTMHDTGILRLREGRRVGVWFWELSRFPVQLARVTEHFDEIWAASQFMAESFSRSIPIPVRPMVMEIPVSDEPTPLRRTDVGLDERFTFLTTFDWKSVVRRKNPYDAIAAYQRAFNDDGRTRLIVRSVNADSHPHEFEELASECANRHDISIVDGWLSNAEARAQIELADCLVSLHRAEGFGLNLATATALATPVLATRYSGNLEFMDDTTSWLVPYDLVSVGSGAFPYDEEAVWAQPRLDDAVEMMREIESHRDEAKRRAIAARERVRVSHSADAASASVLALIKALCARIER